MYYGYIYEKFRDAWYIYERNSERFKLVDSLVDCSKCVDTGIVIMDKEIEEWFEDDYYKNRKMLLIYSERKEIEEVRAIFKGFLELEKF